MLPKRSGGLGVRNLDLFNLSLLAKWRWRLLVDKKASWQNILKSRYRSMGNEQQVGHWTSSISSQWWRDLCALDQGNHASLNWFYNELGRKVGNGKDISFWQETWFGTSSLREVFPSLFSLADDNFSTVTDLGYWSSSSASCDL